MGLATIASELLAKWVRKPPGLNQPQQTGEVGVHHLLQLLMRGFCDGAEQAIAGVVDQDVDMPSAARDSAITGAMRSASVTSSWTPWARPGAKASNSLIC